MNETETSSVASKGGARIQPNRVAPECTLLLSTWYLSPQQTQEIISYISFYLIQWLGKGEDRTKQKTTSKVEAETERGKAINE